MNLYHKIYKAVNEGIQKALLTNMADDVSINYVYHKIDNKVDLIDVFVKELIENFYQYDKNEIKQAQLNVVFMIK